MTIASFLAVCGAFFGFANPIGRFPALILLFPAGLAWCALRADGFRQAFKYGYWTSFAAALASLYWTAIPVHFYGYLPWPLALPVPPLIALYLALYPALFAGLLHLGRERLSPPWLALYAAGLWGCVELAREFVFTGFPWLPLAAALSPWPFAIQTAAYVGSSGLSALLAACAVLLALGRIAPVLCAALVLGAVAVFGNFAINAPVPVDKPISAAVIQGNVEQARKWDPAYQNETVDIYLDLSGKQMAATGPDLLVWPETAMPFYFQQASDLRRRVTDFARDNRVTLVTGAPAAESEGEGHVLFNRAFLVDPDGRPGDVYDKQHLVPFGEYVPFGKSLPFVSKLVQGAGDFRPGQSAAPLRSGDLALGMLICYEAIFPELAQNRVEAGANLLVNISNDAWFGNSPAPWQHLDLALLRAVEQGRYLVRSTNTGVSAIIDPKGRIMVSGGLFTTESLGSPDVGLVSANTVYHRLYGPILALLAGLAVAAPLVGSRLSGGRRTLRRLS